MSAEYDVEQPPRTPLLPSWPRLPTSVSFHCGRNSSPYPEPPRSGAGLLTTALDPVSGLPGSPAVPPEGITDKLGQYQCYYALKAMQVGGHVGFVPSDSHVGVRSLQTSLGVADLSTGTCLRDSSVHQSISCPDGFYRLPEDIVVKRCGDLGLQCPDGRYTCVCSPCKPISARQFHLHVELTAGHFIHVREHDDEDDTGDMALHVGTLSGVNAECLRMQRCAQMSEGDPFTVWVEDAWALARQAMGLPVPRQVIVKLTISGKVSLRLFVKGKDEHASARARAAESQGRLPLPARAPPPPRLHSGVTWTPCASPPVAGHVLQAPRRRDSLL